MEVVVKRGLSGLQQGGAGGEEEGRGGCLCTRWTEWILTGGVAISSRLVRALSRNLVDVVFFDGRGEPVAMLFPPDSNGVAAHRRAQYEAYFNGRWFELAKLVVYGKVANQAGALRRAGQWRRERCGELAKAADEVARLAEEVLRCGGAQCVLGYEGAAASAYWAALSSAFGVPRRRGV
ncbi:MAG: CRISPR-associated endonuclease Cas1 [Pyrobaculum sp.]